MAINIGKILASQSANVVEGAFDAVGSTLSFILIALVGYVIGYVISHIVWRILNIGELHKAVTRYGAMTTKLWSSVTNFVTHYLKWYVTLAILTTTEVGIVGDVYDLMGQLFWLIILTVVGIALGGVIFKIINEALIHIGLDEELKRHNIAAEPVI